MWAKLENSSVCSHGELYSINCTTEMVLPKDKETRILYSCQSSIDCGGVLTSWLPLGFR